MAYFVTSNRAKIYFEDRGQGKTVFFVTAFGNNCDPFTVAGFWYSLFRTDQLHVMEKITIPFLYLMPQFPLYSKVTTDFF